MSPNRFELSTSTLSEWRSNQAELRALKLKALKIIYKDLHRTGVNLQVFKSPYDFFHFSSCIQKESSAYTTNCNR